MSSQPTPQIQPHRAPKITEVLERELETEDPIVAHIVKTEPGENAAAKVMEARIYGYPVEALCGHVWVPSRDPGRYPLCPLCKEIYDLDRSVFENLNESPQSS